MLCSLTLSSTVLNTNICLSVLIHVSVCLPVRCFSRYLFVSLLSVCTERADRAFSFFYTRSIQPPNSSLRLLSAAASLLLLLFEFRL